MDEQDEALRARAEARIGSTLRGKYRLDRVLGIGGMATVFAATHRNQAELAVKILHPELSLREDLKKRFLREGYVGNSVKHPGAVLVVDDDVADDGSAFLVMELLRGKTLEDVWERAGRHLSSRAVTALTAQLLEVLAAAHDKAIVHRDLKPANLFVTVEGALKVLDFGIARLRDAVGGSEHATRTGTLMGTPAFMAPEQAQAIAADIDHQTDLWAVGATMYTLLSGQLVHDGDNSSQLLIKAGTARARPLLSVAPHVEGAIAAVVDRALTFEKAGRWPTASAMHEALLAAAVAAHGRPPSRDVLSTMDDVAPYIRRAEGAPIERTSLGIGGVGSAPAPRLVVNGGADIRANDPTFATPSGPPPKIGPTPIPAYTAPRPSGAPALPGLSTANPVSAEALTSRKAAQGGRRPLFLGVIALLVAVGAVAFFFLRPSGSSSSAPAASSPVAVTAPPAPPPPTGSAAAPEPTAVSTPPVVAPPVASVSPPAPTATTRSSQHSTKSTPQPAATTPKPAAAPATDCSTPYTLDENGDKKWKPECLQR